METTHRHVHLGVSFVFERGGEHEKHTHLGVFCVFDGMGRERTCKNAQKDVFYMFDE
jgi:quercetin dioxygenase-like cupin family protein